MSELFICVVQDSPGTGLGIPVKTKKSLFRTMSPFVEPPFGFKLHERLVPVQSRVRLFRRPFAQDPPLRPRTYSLNIPLPTGTTAWPAQYTLPQV